VAVAAAASRPPPPANTAPVANAGADQVAARWQSVTLDGSASADANGDSLTFLWTLVERPAGSMAALDDPTSIRPSFLVDRAGTFRARLVVNDGQINSAPDEVSVGVAPQNERPVANAGPESSSAVRAKSAGSVLGKWRKGTVGIIGLRRGSANTAARKNSSLLLE